MSRAWLNRLSSGRTPRPGKLHISRVRADMLNGTAPTNEKGIEKYLGSGMA
jgi:hypothetical protein